MYTLHINPSAQDVLVRMQEQVEAVVHAWTNLDIEVALKCTLSLNKVLAQLGAHHFGDEATVYADGTISLGVTGGLHYGLIGHPMRQADNAEPEDTRYLYMHSEPARMGRFCISAEHHESPAPIFRGKSTCEHEFGGTIVALPVPIEWSFHS